jgi:hypothetical protein
MQNLLRLLTANHAILFSFFRDKNWNSFAEHILMEKKNGMLPLKNLDIWKASILVEHFVHV